MKTINLNEPTFIYRHNKKEFIPLISDDAKTIEDFTSLIKNKIAKQNLDEIEGLWGTLGFNDGRKINWKGKIEYSNAGNSGDQLVPSKLVNAEIELLKEAIPELKHSNLITQKFINLSKLHIDFPSIFNEDTIPSLRLSLFLKKDEGALVFYQNDREGDDEDGFSYILPAATDHENSFDRDRLKYTFRALPKYELKDIDGFSGQKGLSDKKVEGEFIIKILIFKRIIKNEKAEDFIPKNSKDLISLIHDNISTKNGLFVKDHKLQIYDKDSRRFKTAVKNTVKVNKNNATLIDTSKKTLVLFHGTFSSTSGSFGEVYEKDGTWLNSMLESNIYEQILAFEHPTILMGAKANVKSFTESLINCKKTNFKHEVDFIGTSQGGLLAKTMAILEPDSRYNIQVGKVALVACANGVGYLDFLEKSTTGLKFIKKMLKAFGQVPAAFVVGLAQISVQAILNLDGFEIMHSGNEKLNKILYTLPKNSNTRYLPIVSTVDHDTKDGEYKFGDGFDAFIDLFLGKDNDWVVSTKNQFKVPSFYAAIDEYNPMKYKNEMFIAKHGKLIEDYKAQAKMTEFFLNPTPGFNRKKGSDDYFDAHCHLFGRNILSTRLIMMIIGDLIDYLKAKKNAPEVQKIETKEKKQIGQLIRNIFRYVVFNSDGYDMFDDLENEYAKFRKKGTSQNDLDDEVVYRYIPLMFDLEMSFKNSYNDDSSITKNVKLLNDRFNEEFENFTKGMDQLSNNIDESNLDIIEGTLEDKSDFVKYLKQGIQLMKTSGKMLGEVDDSFNKQLNELQDLKRLYGEDLFPFIATDPRRTDMGRKIEDNYGRDKTFQGIKLYPPNGYSPADKHFYDETCEFVFKKSLYQWCIDENVPIMVHNSNAGFATFANEIEYTGIIMDPKTMEVSDYSSDIRTKHFDANLFNGGFKKGIVERALVLNYPKIWRRVLEKYPYLKICFAHFGGDFDGSELWRNEIAGLMNDFKNVYTDLSCIGKRETLIEIRDTFMSNENIKNRVMYGSDYVLNMFHDQSFSDYYNNFKEVFKDDFEHMSVDAPKMFLGIE